MKTPLRHVAAVAACLFCSLGAEAAQSMPPLPVQSPDAIAKAAVLRNKFDRAPLRYLEDVRTKRAPYMAPSEIDPRFTIAFYVNAKGSGPNAQRMWVLQRKKLGGPWQLAIWDQRYWRRRGLPAGLTPPYSWPVSTGRKYVGDRKSGPTPRGIFALDERRYRIARGYSSPGMINVMYIDYHYSSGRRSGVAFHGTTRSRYKRLGRIDSHGCIRMTQSNARALLDRLQGRDGVLSKELRLGEVPRFWTHQRSGNRFGYKRDGTLHFKAVASKSPSTVTRTDVSLPGAHAPKPVLTKTGYRAIAIIFRD